MIAKYFKYSFFLIAAFELFAQIDFLPFQNFHNFTKPMLMPALALYFYFYTKNKGDARIRNIVLLALFFAWLGDLFLMFAHKDPLYFMLGLGAFLVMQLLYIQAFKVFSLEGLVSKKYYTIFVLLFGLITMIFLFPNLGDLKIPVALYFMAILTMVLSALTFWNSHSYGKIVFYGALLFMISDSLIAINKFQFAVPFAGFLIMSTYILAQWLIVEGIRNKVSG